MKNMLMQAVELIVMLVMAIGSLVVLAATFAADAVMFVFSWAISASQVTESDKWFTKRLGIAPWWDAVVGGSIKSEC